MRLHPFIMSRRRRNPYILATSCNYPSSSGGTRAISSPLFTNTCHKNEEKHVFTRGWTIQDQKPFHISTNAPSSTTHHIDESSSRNDNYLDNEPQNPRLKSLYQASKSFFQNHHDMKPSQKTREIGNLVLKWSDLWIKQSLTNNHNQHNQHHPMAAISTTESDDEETEQNETNMKEQSIIDQKDYSTGTYTLYLNLALSGWSSVPSTSNSDNACKLLKRVESIYHKSPKTTKPFQPTALTYGSAMSACATSIDGSRTNNGAIVSRQILERMKEVYESGRNDLVKPNRVAYNICLQAYSIRGMVAEAEELLREMEEHCDDDEEICPDVISYTTCIACYANRKDQSQRVLTAECAESLLNKMLDKYKETGDFKVMPNQYTFGVVISTFAKSGTRNAAQNAERILRQQIDLFEKELYSGGEKKRSDTLKPSTAHFVTVLEAYSSRKVPGGAKKAKDLIVLMEKMDQEGVADTKPNFKCFVICLDILAKSGERRAPEEAEQMLNRLEDLYLSGNNPDMNNYSYNTVMDAWSRCGRKDAYEKTKKVFDQMIATYEETQNEALRPDKFSYTALMKAVCAAKEPGFPEKARAILYEMEEQYLKGNKGAKPDSIAYWHVLNAFAQKPGNPQETKALHQRMEDRYIAGNEELRPTVRTYNSIINAYVNSDLPDAARQAEYALEQLEKASVNDDTLRPDRFSFTSCLHALANSHDEDKVERAEAIFKKMWDHASEGSFEDGMPSSITWSTLLWVYAKSNIKNTATKTLRVLQRMERSGAKPIIAVYNAILLACAQGDNSNNKAIDIAVEVFREIQSRDDMKPDSNTYNNLLSTCRLIKDVREKENTVEGIFKLCCRDGLVNPRVITNLKRISSENLFYRLMEKPRDHGFVKINEIPQSWTRNSRG